MKKTVLAFLCLFTTFTATAAIQKVDVYHGVSNTAIIEGEKEIGIVDAQYLTSDALRLAANVLERKKPVKWIYVTHAHPDHYFGGHVLKKVFPDAQFIASKVTVKEINQRHKRFIKRMSQPFIGGQALFPTAYNANTLELDGETLEIHPAFGDTPHSHFIFVPSQSTLIAGDILFEDSYLFTLGLKEIAPWQKSLDTIRAMNPKRLIVGHGGENNTTAILDFMREYLNNYDKVRAKSKSGEDLIKGMKAIYPDLANKKFLKWDAHHRYGDHH